MGKDCHGGPENPQNELFIDPIVIFEETMVNLLASYYTISNYSLPDKENFDVKNDV